MWIVAPSDSDVQLVNMPGQMESGVVTEHNFTCKNLSSLSFKRMYNGIFLTLIMSRTAVW
jgi:hypothetical protein